MNPAQNLKPRVLASQIIPAVLVFCFAVSIAWISFTVEDPEPYLFPQLLSAAMTALAVVNLVGAFRQGSASDISVAMLLRLLPGLLVLLGLIAWAAEALGFYVSGCLAMFLIYCLYDPNAHSLARLAKRLSISVAFMAVLYLLFAKLLQVQTPRGMFF